jgi:hypothetical protein
MRFVALKMSPVSNSNRTLRLWLPSIAPDQTNE